MKKHFLLRLGIFLVIFFGLSIFGYRYLFHPTQPSASEVLDQKITLILPDQEYIALLSELNFETSELIIPAKNMAKGRVVYNSDVGILESVDHPIEYVIDLNQLSLSISSDSKVADFAITPAYKIRNQSEEVLSKYNQQLGKIYRSPLAIKLKDGGDFTDLNLDSENIRKIIIPRSTSPSSPIEINKSLLLSLIDSRLSEKQREYFNGDLAYQNVRTAVNARFMDEQNPIVMGVDDGPSSRGEKAERYLEVDLSQQKMYFFIGGKLYNSYRISTGIDYPTPVGEFHILNKAPKAFSEIYQVWMPYWMGFKYANDVGAYLGLHEIAYAVDARGKPIYNHGYYIGDKMTGGCVAMEPKDSKQIYDLSEVGMLVRIVK